MDHQGQQLEAQRQTAKQKRRRRKNRKHVNRYDVQMTFQFVFVVHSSTINEFLSPLISLKAIYLLEYAHECDSTDP